MAENKTKPTSASVDDFIAKLGKHKKSVACLYINKLDDVDLDVLYEIIARQYQTDVF